MKKLSLIVLLALFCALSTAAQTPAKVEFNQQTKTFSIASSSKSSAIETDFYFEDNGVTLPIYITQNGRCYILKKSKKTGKEYKKYLPKEVCLPICKAYNITYVESTKK